MGYKLILVGDDGDWRNIVQTCAKEGDYSLEICKTGALGLTAILERRPEMALLDLKIPDVGGLSWLNVLRQMELGKELPLIVLNDRKTDDSVAEAYRLGVDDYIAKPCHPAEFLARMRAVLRRRFEREQFMGAEMTIGSVMLDPAHHQCLVRGKPVELRPREFELLEILMRKVGRVLSRSYLLESIWGMSHTADTRTVDVAVSRLRKALGLRAGSWVETVERYGYRFRNPGETGR